MKILIDHGNGIKEIKPVELPKGAIISGFHKSCNMLYGVVSKNIVQNCKKSSLEITFNICFMKAIQVWHIPGYQKMWVATDFDCVTSIYYNKPKRKIRIKEWSLRKAPIFDSFSCNSFGQTWDDEPWPVWVKIE